MSLPRYAAYKTTGVEWLGAIPAHWEVWKVAHGFEVTGSGTTPPSDNQDWYDGGICWVTTSELRETVIFDTGKKVSHEAVQNFSALKIFPPGSLAIAMYGATIGRLGIFGVEATTNQACCVLHGEKALLVNFMFYWLQAFQEQVILLASGGGQPNISQEKIRSLRVACPLLEEQQTIADFLDAQTAKIDTLLAKKRQLIDKLKEKRGALIARTVTRGLPPAAAQAAGLEPHPAMKDSGVEWLGGVPVHWEVKRGRFLHEINPRNGQASLLSAEDEVSFVPMEAVGEFGGLNLEQNKSLEEIGSGYTEFENGDVVIAKITPCFENYKGALANNLMNGVAFGTTELHVLRVGQRLDRNFLFYLSVSHVYRKMGESEMYGAGGQKRVPTEFIKDFRISLPPQTEQQAIAAYLDHETARIDQLTTKVEAAIARLTEYRQALITAAVTGKIDVRNNARLKEVA